MSKRVLSCCMQYFLIATFKVTTNAFINTFVNHNMTLAEWVNRNMKCTNFK